ncbi:MAG: hypothetical protein IPP46_12785 [Bacteroidetes bacterium]|nr:hypothetical protein [Bacteroidota bacterium]
MAKSVNMSNIILDKEEFALLSDAEIFLVKKRLSEKLNMLLSDCIKNIEHCLTEHPGFLEEEVVMNRPKISKGENYLSFPWQILDYPRLFGREDIFAIRTLCWWGQSFSITLHLSGKYADQFHSKLNHHLAFLADNDYFICINSNQWHHHFGSDNYLSAGELSGINETITSLYQRNHFIKIMKKIPLSDWMNLSEKSGNIYRELFRIISD